MKFIVSGADKKTGRDANLAVTAATPEEAERMAARQGMMVVSVKPVPAQMATDVGTGALPIWGDDPADGEAPGKRPPGAPLEGGGAASGAARPATATVAARPTPSGISLQEPAPPAAASAPPAGAEAGAAPGGRDSVIPASARYHVIQNPALYLLEMAVNKHILEGWEPLGGIQVSYAMNQLVFYQSLVRKGAE